MEPTVFEHDDVYLHVESSPGGPIAGSVHKLGR